MKFANMILLNDDGSEQWFGGLRDFIRDNQFSPTEAHQLCRDLRDLQRTEGRTPEPVVLNMGAGGVFMVCLAEPT